MRALYKDGYRYKKAGRHVDCLAPAGRMQGDFWTEPDSIRSKSLMKALDRQTGITGAVP